MHRLLIVDDSPYYRLRFSKIFARSERLDVVGVAEDGDVAIKQIVELRPDIVLLDLLMPRLDGFGVLRWAMTNHPLPVVVCSSFSDRDRVFKALEYGAVDFLLKPTPRATQLTSSLEDQIIRRVEEAANARTVSPKIINAATKAAIVAAEHEAREASVELVCIAASTGGPGAIQRLVAELPPDLKVPIIVAQHMPVGFTGPFAERLDSICHYKVREARDREIVKSGRIYIAPAGAQTLVSREGGMLVLQVINGLQDYLHAPSGDALFASAATACKEKTLAIVLTGMGEDGAQGAEAVRKAGGHVLAESNESAIVFGMPRSVIERGCANAMLPLGAIPRILLSYTISD